MIPRCRRTGSTDTDRHPIQRYAWSELINYQPLVNSLCDNSKSTRLMNTDLTAAHYVLFNNYDYPKPAMVRKIIRGLFGSGTCFLLYNLRRYLDGVNIRIITAEGNEHKNQVGFLFQRFVRELLSNTIQLAQDFVSYDWQVGW